MEEARSSSAVDSESFSWRIVRSMDRPVTREWKTAGRDTEVESQKRVGGEKTPNLAEFESKKDRGRLFH